MSKRWISSTLFEKDGQFNTIILARFDTESFGVRWKELKILNDYEEKGITSDRSITVVAEYFYYYVEFGWEFPPDKDNIAINKEYKSNVVCELHNIFKSEEEAFMSAKKAFKERGHKNINTAIISSLFTGFK